MPVQAKASAQPKIDPYQQALNKAASARSISQSAQSQDDWKLVVSRWQQAIQLLKTVPKGSPYRVLVQPKLSEYQRSLAYANKQAARKPNNDVIPIDPGIVISSTGSGQPTTVATKANNEQGKVFRAKIKRREGGTPVIDVTFNGQQTFEMIVDTGASGTVITQQMANALGSRTVGKARVTTASDRNVEVPLTYVDSISVGGATVKGVVVAVGGSALDVGLLGHDFFGDYDVTVKRDVVEFQARS
jgi:predicted aspartyl protease